MQESDRWCRKAIAGAGLVVADAELVFAGICWCRKVAAGVCWCRKAVAGAGRAAAGVCWCRKAVAGAGLAAAGAEPVDAFAGKWPPVQE